jgi:RimJ/RimL family protein N-acetyltransferase
MLVMSSDTIPSDIQYSPIQEYELYRINEFSNMPEIAEHFETIPPVTMESTKAFYRYVQNGIISLWGIHKHEQIIGGAGFIAQPPGTRLSHIATFFLFLEPDVWGKGIGRKTLQFLENEAINRGYIRMECMVTIQNTRAIRLYERMGYVQEGVKKKAYLIDGEYTDLIIMGKILTSNIHSPL